MNVSPEFIESCGFWWDGSMPWSVRPHDAENTEKYLPRLENGFIELGAPCEPIDCRIPEDVRREIALCKRPLMSYKQYVESNAALADSAFPLYIGRRSASE